MPALADERRAWHVAGPPQSEQLPSLRVPSGRNQPRPRWAGRLWVPLAALAALPLSATGDFVTSLHTNYVVNLDFDSDMRPGSAVGDGASVREEIGTLAGGEEQVIAFAGGKRKFRCVLPTGHNASGVSRAGNASKSKKHFLNAKLASIRGTCWKMRKEYWSYEICFGRKITQLRPDSDMHFSLGEHLAEADEIFANGTVHELYVGGTDNRTTEVHFECGSSEISSRVFKVEEDRPLYYTITVSSPAFCSWHQADGSQALAVDGTVLPVSSLLEELRGSCINVTQGWWTYEYCYPRTIVQYHLQGNGKRDPEHIMGTLPADSPGLLPNQVNMSMVRLKPSISARERRAPPSNHQTLRQRLADGAVCDETGRARVTTMLFQCPPNWPSRPESKVVSINEGSLCEYEIMVHTTLLCGHPKLIPKLPRGKEVIQCRAEPRQP